MYFLNAVLSLTSNFTYTFTIYRGNVNCEDVTLYLFEKTQIISNNAYMM